MPNRLEQLERESIEYEERPCAPVDVVEEGGSPWNAFRRDPKVLRPDVTELIERAFDCGGFVAGGCGRWLRNVGQVTPVKRGAYVHEGGDIDLFFKDPASWSEFISSYSENQHPEPGKPHVKLSEGKLAANITFARGKGMCHGYNSTPTVQAIRCVTGTPEEVILSFDFVNSMVAFDRARVWVASGWGELERSKRLGVAWWGSRSVAFRVKKYMTKYGYKSLEDLSEGRMFEQLVAVTNAMDERRKLTSRDAWFTVVNLADIPLETKLTILASTFSGVDTGDIFELTRPNRYRFSGSGAYENIYSSLLGRHEAAKALALKEAEMMAAGETEWEEDPHDRSLMRPVQRAQPEKAFDADAYCWAR